MPAELSETLGYDLRIGYYIFYMMRGQFWLLSAGGLYVGFGLAARTVVPTGAVFAGLVVIGPLLGGFALLYNECTDLDTDRRNPRKATSPLVRGDISRDTALRASALFAALALLAAFAVSPLFAAVVAVLAALAFAYSHPGIRLKERAGLDIAANMLGFGVLSPLAGWVLARPPAEFPWLYMVPVSLVFAGLYAPTTLLDRDADRRAGLRTLSVVLGGRNTARLSIALMAAAVASSGVLGWYEYVITREMLYRVLPVYALQPVIYLVLLGRGNYQRIMTAVYFATTTNIVATLLFLLMYTGAM